MAARRRAQWIRDWERTLRRLERQLPGPLRRMLRQLGKNLHEAQRQFEAAGAERDARWRKLQRQVRGDAARVLRQLRGAVGASPAPARRARPAGGRARRARKR